MLLRLLFLVSFAYAINPNYPLYTTTSSCDTAPNIEPYMPKQFVCRVNHLMNVFGVSFYQLFYEDLGETQSRRVLNIGLTLYNTIIPNDEKMSNVALCVYDTNGYSAYYQDPSFKTNFQTCLKPLPTPLRDNIVNYKEFPYVLGLSRQNQLVASYYTYGDAYPGIGCPNGNYMLPAPFYFKEDLFMFTTPPVCQPCPAGTWNTCKEKDTCLFHPLSHQHTLTSWLRDSRYLWKDDIYVFPDRSLTGNCHPCNLAILAPKHYGWSETFPYGYTTSSPEIPYFCPGGAAKPQLCPTGSTAIVDQNGYATICTCKSGTYNIGINTVECKSCEPGYKCFGGTRTPCEAGSFSSGGTSTCTPCSTDRCFIETELRSFCKTGSTQDSKCVNCRLCSNLGSKDMNRVHCLGVANITLF